MDPENQAQSSGMGQGSLQVSSGAMIDQLPELIAAVNSDDRQRQREATVHFRKLLSIGSHPQLINPANPLS